MRGALNKAPGSVTVVTRGRRPTPRFVLVLSHERPETRPVDAGVGARLRITQTIADAGKLLQGAYLTGISDDAAPGQLPGAPDIVRITRQTPDPSGFRYQAQRSGPRLAFTDAGRLEGHRAEPGPPGTRPHAPFPERRAPGECSERHSCLRGSRIRTAVPEFSTIGRFAGPWLAV